MFMVKQKNFRAYNLLNVSINSIVCMCLILSSVLLLISRNPQRGIGERSFDSSSPDQRVKFVPGDRRRLVRRTTKPPLKDSIFNVSNLDGFKSDVEEEQKQEKEEKDKEDILNKHDNTEDDDDKITKSEEEFDQNDEFHPPSGKSDLKNNLGKIFNMFRKSKSDEQNKSGSQFSSKMEATPQLPMPEQPFPPSESIPQEKPVNKTLLLQSLRKYKDDTIEAELKEETVPNLKLPGHSNMVLIKELDQVDFPDDSAGPDNDGENSSLDQEYIDSESLVQNPVSESWVSHALQNPSRKEASEEIKKIFEFFSRRNKVSVGMGECSKVSHVGGFVDDQKFHPDHSQYLCEDADFEGHFKQGCIIYSFGVNDNWDFENTTASKGCKVLVYDVYVKHKPENLVPNVYFFRQGLGVRSEKKLVGDEEVQFSTLEEIIKVNNHQKKFISYIKINLRGEEWQILDEMMSETPLIGNNIVELGLTTHLHSALVDHRLYQKYLNILNKLTALGFQLFLSKEIEISNESYKEPYLDDKIVALTNYLAFFRL